MTSASGSLEDQLRERLGQSPQDQHAAVALSEILLASDRVREAQALLAPFVESAAADIHVLTAAANVEKSLRRYEPAIALYARARAAAPSSAVAEHNLAGMLGDVQRYAEAEEGARRALAKGLDAPETWLVRGRALLGLGRVEHAAEAFRQAIRRRPNYAEAQAALAQLIWMALEDPGAAAAQLDATIGDIPNDPELRLRRAQLAEYVDSREAAYRLLAETPAEVRAAAEVQAVMASYACWIDPAAAMDHARRAIALAPDDQIALAALCQAQLANGEATAAAETALVMRERWSLNQEPIALLATAWRLAGDARYHALYDYERLVRAQSIDTPAGWSSLGAYLADLGEALNRSHLFRGHPVGQSLRSGAQLPLGPQSPEPAIRAFFEAVQGPVQRYIAALGAGDDPVRSRITGAFQFNGMWSVRLKPGGRHVDHIHPMGWLSSACYITLPEAIDRGHEGWTKFGESAVATPTPLEAEHYVRPEPGMLVLFPSYMWHGTVPFSGDSPRLTVAFDLLPG